VLGLSGVGEGFTLVVCEKPDAAKRISEALAETAVQTLQVEGAQVFRFRRADEEFVVGAALGHIYGVWDPFDERGVYPVFDVEWFPANLLGEHSSFVEGRIESFRKLSAGAAKFINACDYDVEGETIGFNILRYACAGKEQLAQRAKFSTLTKQDLVQAFENLEPPMSNNLALAGRTRHVVDFMWGVNLSRALSESVRSVAGTYRTLSVGRVQGPALSFVVDREVERRTFVPTPFWVVKGLLQKGDLQFEAVYVIETIRRKAEAERVQRSCTGKSGVVSKVSKSLFEEEPPPPFNIGDLQKEAYRVFGYAPTRTLQIAERLYLDAIISYPRTSSQKLPPSIGYAKVLAGLGRMRRYSREVEELKVGPLSPKEGKKDDPAHPAIYPTGEQPRRVFSVWEERLFDLVVRRFLATFATRAVRERVTVLIKIGEFEFKAVGGRRLSEGWLRYYGSYARREDDPLPPMEEGDEVKVIGVESLERFASRPPRYNQSSLLEEMERENLGTKATRAETISTLISRGYITSENMAATDLGFAVVEMMKAHSPDIVSTKLTRKVEENLAAIEDGKEDARTLIRDTIGTLSQNLVTIGSSEESIGRAMGEAISSALTSQYILGPCPVCKTGKLKIIRSKKTQKRFVGCTNYPSACTASAPLPQKGVIKTTTKACQACAWPIIYVKLGRSPWRLCVNPRCPRKTGKRYEVRALQKRG